MPWCETCDRHYNKKSLAPDGTCMTCGSFIADGSEDTDADKGPPWHFWLLVALLAVYLGWRLVQLIMWLIK